VQPDRIGLRRASHEVIDQPVGGASGHAVWGRLAIRKRMVPEG
jgi:hypothetical protein